jgi:hypothetical protein
MLHVPDIKEHALLKMTTTDKAMQLTVPFLRKNKAAFLELKEQPDKVSKILSAFLSKIKVSDMEIFEIGAYLEVKMAKEIGAGDDFLWPLRQLNKEIQSGNRK